MGWFLIEAARKSNAATAEGLDEVLQTIAQQPNGAWLLGIMALGLIAYGIYTIIQARYRRVVNV
ncbi:DUF1206 domain-containing protein [Nostoc sp. 'Lobaria pulmonaria (5183) cyanobiont']|uniref:DUF1206 domain-containing protein n=1 Tax=Nostoc sp. 'Lobaria pulmonaria (5183) cyanobiont' TaxID=1618022 RepID=UPI002D7A283F|nr:DUF1206 domain-containing protein [Nostoc sp. 'Lobaria pulmonaria (5183) cyanobiont']